jgi:hypothetical protein
LVAPLIAERAYAGAVAESNLQHDGSKAGFLHFVITRYYVMGIASDKALSRK